MTNSISPRTLHQDYIWGPMAALGGGAIFMREVLLNEPGLGGLRPSGLRRLTARWLESLSQFQCVNNSLSSDQSVEASQHLRGQRLWG